MNLASRNIFSALDTKKKKKASKHAQETSDRKKGSTKPKKLPEVQQHLFSSEAKPAINNWADTDEEDDFEDDIGPLPQSWLQGAGPNGDTQQTEAEDGPSDSEEEARVEQIHAALGLEVTKDEDEDEEEQEEGTGQRSEPGSDVVREPAEPAHQSQVSVPEKQLSKKEQKRRELEDMNRVFAELGIETQPSQDDESFEVKTASNHEIVNGGDGGASKKKKKKDKDRKQAEASEASPASIAVPEPETEQHDVLDPAEAKKLLAKKKAAQAKKANASLSATVAAREARERAAKVSRVKDKKNYNQAPTR